MLKRSNGERSRWLCGLVLAAAVARYKAVVVSTLCAFVAAGAWAAGEVEEVEPELPLPDDVAAAIIEHFDQIILLSYEHENDRPKGATAMTPHLCNMLATISPYAAEISAEIGPYIRAGIEGYAKMDMDALESFASGEINGIKELYPIDKATEDWMRRRSFQTWTTMQSEASRDQFIMQAESEDFLALALGACIPPPRTLPWWAIIETAFGATVIAFDLTIGGGPFFVISGPFGLYHVHEGYKGLRAHDEPEGD